MKVCPFAGAGMILWMNWHRLFFWSLLGLVATILLLVSTSCSNQYNPQDILYLGWDNSERIQLFRHNLSGDGTMPTQLTGLGEGSRSGDVTTFNPSPDGTRIAYSMDLDSGSSEIRLLTISSGTDELLVACDSAECSEITWSPDNRRLVYERRELDDETAKEPHLWWLNANTAETVPLIEESENGAYGASFSPDGQMLAYVSPKDYGVVVVNLLTGDQQRLSSDTGMPPIWSPDSQSIIYSIRELLVFHEEDGSDHTTHAHEYISVIKLYRQEVFQSSPPVQLSPDSTIDDSSPSWSPDGEWITLGRRPADTAGARQLWLMQPDGSNARTLTSDTDIHYGPTWWSSDGRYLVYQRYPSLEPGATSSIWVMDMETGEQRQIAEMGFLPRWLPEF
ncbi:MAG: hypothetical protein R3C44_13180 [Chloroflexota bacterium]